MKNKKAFTVVELVIVIAIIAILAAVLIPTFANIIKKANVSKDNQLIRNLNTALASSRAENSNKPHANMTEALEAAEKFGYEVNKINASATDNEILWDQVNDVFCYLNGEIVEYIPESVDQNDKLLKGDYRLWKIYNAKSGAVPAQENQVYSIYLGENADISSALDNNNVLKVKVGVDVGKRTDVTSIEYSYTPSGSEKAHTDVVIFTNGGTLTIDGYVDSSDSTKGDVVKHYGNADSVNIIKIAGASYHEFGTVKFTQIAQGHYVAEEGAEVLVLLVVGSGADVKVDNNGAKIDKSYTIDASAKDTLHGGNQNLDYYEVTAAQGQTQEQAVAEAIETLEKGATLFAGGTGTKADPFLISNREEFENISAVTSYSYFKWVGESSVDASNWSSSNYLCGSFDGNGVTFNNLDLFLFNYVWNGSESWEPGEDTANTYTVKNITVNANIVSDGWIAAIVQTAGVHNFVMENVNVHGYIEGSTGVSSFICFGAGNFASTWTYDGHITFKNCNSDAIIVAKSGNAVGFIAHAMTATSAATVTLENSNYTGSMSCSSCKYICGNWINATITDDQSSTKNNVIYNSGANGWTYKAEGKTGSFTVKTGTLPSGIGDVFVLNAESGATKAIISLVISPDPGNFTSTYMTEEVNVVDGKVTSENVKYFAIRINANGVTETGAHGNYYDVVNSIYNGKLGSNTIVRITQYNAAGGIISITNYNFNDK